MMENKMTNQKRLEEYLVGTNGYLKSDISNGKVIMLSGKWGSGKTHFWQKKIQTVLNEKDKKIPNHYISLYGKTSIDEIRNEVFLKIFESVDSSKLEEKGTKLAKNTIDLIVSFIKSIDIDGVKIDLSTISDNSFRQLEKFLKNKKIKKTVEYLNKSAIICFDDFERKSKDIDLNDLFGFITQLTLNFSCKVVIILNDDVFEGVEKDVFSRVKEKSVSKFLKYEPSIKELFENIFENDEEYRKLDDYKEIILKTIEDTKELNARIYIQVLDNLVEWIKYQEIDANILRCLILVNINFVLYHQIYYFDESNENFVLPISFKRFDIFPTKALSFFNTGFDNFRNTPTKCEVIDLLKSSVKAGYDKKTDNNITKASESLPRELELIENYGEEFWLYVYFEHNLNFRQNISSEQLLKINNFIETGILINE